MGRGEASGEGTGFGSAEIGEDVSVAVDQENVGVVGRREGERGVGQIQTLVRAIAMALSSPQKPQGKTEKEGRREERKSQLKQSETTADGVNNESNYLVGPICAKAVVATASNPDRAE